MPLSRVLDTADPVPDVASSRASTVPASQGASAFFAQPLVPILTAVGVLILVVAAISFARSAGLVAALWGAGGLAVAVWLRTGRDRAYDLCFGGLLMVGILAGEILAGNSPGLSVVFTVANMIEIVGAVLLIRRFAPTLNLSTVDGAIRFLMAGAVLAPIPAALFTTVWLTATAGADPVASFQTWWFGHALGIAVFGAFGVSLTRSHLAALRRPWRAVEAGVLMILVVAVAAEVFVLIRSPVGFAIIPVMILVAVRLRVLGIAAALVIVTLAAVGGAMAGLGPFAGPGVELADRAVLAQIMVFLGCLPIFLIAALLEERDALAERARLGRARAEAASEAKSRLLANVAHEIKSPIAGVIGIGDLWKGGQLGPVTPAQAEMADMLVRTARQVEALAHDLLDVARAESGAVKVDLRPTDVPGLLEDVRRAVALQPGAAGLRLEMDCAGDGLVALADSQRLAQVVGNLASNAVKYGAPGGMVRFAALRIPRGVRIEITDRGPGLSLQKQAQLFEPFNRLGLERSAIEGHGIGLALAKRLTELQGGVIGVTSTPGAGATFWIELPAA
ncbi:MAG: MASE1 domain-containing protein [Alphaproteobacteria bacterium]|nr:MASE1 domain-containing protein [Alphaproteobacteria bacterium]MBU1527281.1 MASE1 domain-containing protein [Alphaproteobacteria bacterium]MBU2350368.1 MASE1 domain-containing protein [Alphaproteobacteria bacterium]MBU2383520.1 MASE1 domain-containing protein [Alphaproteobacteria bacterium]